MAEISSSSFDPVFDTLKCDIPEIPPVSNTPLILDCEIPRAIDPIFDCNDIDLQLPISYVAAFAVAVGGAGQPGARGPKGDDGADGADGEDGCDPVLTISRSVTCVYTVDDVGVEVGVTQTDDCEYNIHFDFSLICGFDYTGTKKGCC